MTEARTPAGRGEDAPVASAPAASAPAASAPAASAPAASAPAAGAAVEVTLSREELRAAVVHQPVERVRVRREVVTEQVSVTVAVRREVLRVEREGIAPGTRSPGEASGPFAAGGSGAWEMVLHEERPVVGVEVVPVERVRVQVVTGQGVQEIEADLAVEHVEVTLEQ